MVLIAEVGVTVAVLAALWVLSDWARYRSRALRVRRALHPGAPPLRPAGPPIEQIAADLRRIRREIAQAPPAMPVARMRGWVRAYDDVLVAACRALGAEERIYSVPEGPQRDLERERVERLLSRAGLRSRAGG